MGLNECTLEHPLWFRTPLKMSNSALFEGIGAILDTAVVYAELVQTAHGEL